MIELMKEKLLTLDTSQSSIQRTSEEFFNIVREDETFLEDLVKLWKYFILNKTNKLAYLYLANDIIQNSFFQNLNIHEVFLSHVPDVFTQLYSNLSDKLRREIIRVIDIWVERKIFEPTKLEHLRKFLSITTLPSLELDNPLLIDCFLKEKIKISDKIKEFAQNLENLEKTKDTTQSETLNTEEDIKRKEKKNRESLIKNAADIIKKQNQIYFKHVFCLQEVDKMIDKIQTFKSLNSNDMQLDS